MLVAGTLPVLLTGLGQMFLGWQGPWQLGGGAIIWFVAPGGEPQGRLSALFDYANIAGAWLGVVWPLMLAAVLRPGWLVAARCCSGAHAFNGVAVVLTQSRNAMGRVGLVGSLCDGADAVVLVAPPAAAPGLAVAVGGAARCPVRMAPTGDGLGTRTDS